MSVDDRAIPNRILWADAYTLGSHDLVSPAMRHRAAYHLVFRRFAAPRGVEGFGEGAIVFHGLTGILRKLLARPLERREIDEAAALLGRFHLGGGPFPWDRGMWERIAELGHWPVRIWARPDGATVNVGEPVVQVVAEPGFGELAAHLEARLVQVWAPTARATIARRWLAQNEDLVRRTTDVVEPAQIRALAGLQLSDFGDRGGSCAEESEVLGLAHLTSHDGTDTVAAAWRAWQASGGAITGGSIRALAHRVVQGWDREEEAFAALFEVTRDGGIGSYVADCYDQERAIRDHLIPLARRAAETGGLVVIRPDSGDRLANLRRILDAAHAAGLTRVNGKGLRELTSVRYIQADALDLATIRYELNAPLVADGWSVPMCGVYGVGGALRDGLSREMLGATWKVAAVGADLRPVAKFSPGGKHSIPGLVKVIPTRDGGPTVWPASADELDAPALGDLRLVYDRGRFTDAYADDAEFANVRRRVLDDFGRFVPSPEPLSPDVIAIRERLRARHAAVAP